MRRYDGVFSGVSVVFMGLGTNSTPTQNLHTIYLSCGSSSTGTIERQREKDETEARVTRMVDLYYEICRRYELKPVAEVTIALRFEQVTHLRLRPEVFHVSDLLPLGDVLKVDEKIRILSLSGCAMGDSGAYVLQEVLERAHVLRALDVSFCGIGDLGVAALARGVIRNRSLERLNLRGNSIGVDGASSLASVVRRSRSLRLLDVSANNLRVAGVQTLFAALQERRKRSALALRSSLSSSDPTSSSNQLRRRSTGQPSIPQLREIDHDTSVEYDESGAWFTEVQPAGEENGSTSQTDENEIDVEEEVMRKLS